MAEILTHDNSVPAEVMDSQAADEAESLAIGEQLEAAHSQKFAGKYDTAEDLESAYLALQKKLGSQDEPAEEAKESSDYTFDDALADYQSTGEMTEELSQALEDMTPQEVFEAMAGQGPEGRDMTEQDVASVYNSVGGEEQYQALIGWAKDNFSEAEISAYDAVMDTGDMNQISFALQALYARYTDAVGSDGDLLQGKPAASQSTFRSQAELIQAMNDPRYESDPAYRDDVIQKLGRSDLNF